PVGVETGSRGITHQRPEHLRHASADPRRVEGPQPVLAQGVAQPLAGGDGLPGPGLSDERREALERSGLGVNFFELALDIFEASAHTLQLLSGRSAMQGFRMGAAFWRYAPGVCCAHDPGDSMRRIYLMGAVLLLWGCGGSTQKCDLTHCQG